MFIFDGGNIASIIKLVVNDHLKDISSNLIITKEERLELLRSLMSDEVSSKPTLILQHIQREEFLDNADKCFFRDDSINILDTKASAASHPLTYRLTVRELTSITDNIQVGRRYSAFSVPIIYFGNFSIGDDNSDSRLNFLDSSIWHRYCRCLDDENNILIEPLLNIIKEVNQYQNDHRYQLNVALEYLDYSIRMLLNQNLAEIGDHANYVHFFSFHSETEVAREFDNLLKGNELLPRKFLIIDDYARNSLKNAVSEPPIVAKNTEVNPCSGTIEGMPTAIPSSSLTGSGTNDSKPDSFMKKNIEKYEKQINTSKGFFIYKALTSIHKDYQNSIFYFDGILDDLQTAFSKNRNNGEEKIYDIILLDYLLNENDGKREKGTDFIRFLEKTDFARGPNNKFWIFGVSSFSSALSGEIQKGSVANIGTHCYVNTGADPICTPELFKFKLLSYLHIQENECRYITNGLKLLDKITKVNALDVHKYITLHQEQIGHLLHDAANDSHLVKSLRNNSLFEEVGSDLFNNIIPYMENYLRLLAYHDYHAREPMLMDLEVMELMVNKENRLAEHNRRPKIIKLITWIESQRQNLLSPTQPS